jgi:hypothetical protein
MGPRHTITKVGKKQFNNPIKNYVASLDKLYFGNRSADHGLHYYQCNLVRGRWSADHHLRAMGRTGDEAISDKRNEIYW